jgi:chorismate synthase
MLFDSASSFGRTFKILSFGESHGPAIGVVIDGIKPGLSFDLGAIQAELNRRRPGFNLLSTSRKENDELQILSGVYEGKTTGHPIALIVFNQNQKSSDYENLREIFRPGHADLTYEKKYGIRDPRGGGRSSARETIARVAAGAWAKSQLKRAGVSIRAYSKEIAGVKCQKIDWDFVEKNPLRSADPSCYEAQKAEVENAKLEGDSVGGVVELWIEGLPIGLGDPTFAKLDGLLGYACLSIGSVKGVEFGSGFDSTKLRGSQNNDSLATESYQSSHAGGVLGGISDGAPLVLRCAVKPTSSIAKPQKTRNKDNEIVDLVIGGRHDPCICPRVVPVIESMAAIVVYDAYLTQQALNPNFPQVIGDWDLQNLELFNNQRFPRDKDDEIQDNGY